MSLEDEYKTIQKNIDHPSIVMGFNMYYQILQQCINPTSKTMSQEKALQTLDFILETLVSLIPGKLINNKEIKTFIKKTQHYIINYYKDKKISSRLDILLFIF